jgi:hypothetical protein
MLYSEPLFGWAANADISILFIFDLIKAKYLLDKHFMHAQFIRDFQQNVTFFRQKAEITV